MIQRAAPREPAARGGARNNSYSWRLWARDLETLDLGHQRLKIAQGGNPERGGGDLGTDFYLIKGAHNRPALKKQNPLNKLFRVFHLFDTFEGFRKTDLEAEHGEASSYSTRSFADTHIPMVLRRIRGNENIRIHKGYFPDTAGEVSQDQFALVHIDADLHNPTRAALEFFYPRLSPGGVIFIHDYNHRWEGVKKAVDEFLVTIPEALVLVPDTDSTVMIIRNKR